MTFLYGFPSAKTFRDLRETGSWILKTLFILTELADQQDLDRFPEQAQSTCYPTDT